MNFVTEPLNLGVQNVILISLRIAWTVLGIAGSVASMYVLIDIAKDEAAIKIKMINGMVHEVVNRDKRSERIRLIELLCASFVGLLSLGQPLPPVRISFVGWTTAFLILLLELGLVSNTILTAKFRKAIKKEIAK